jgi:hypothetical protein
MEDFHGFKTHLLQQIHLAGQRSRRIFALLPLHITSGWSAKSWMPGRADGYMSTVKDITQL